MIAYRVPFELTRRPPVYRIRNTSLERLHGVSFTLHGSGVMSANAPAVLRAGESLDVSIAGHRLARDSILVVRWFRPDGVEYLWRVSF